MGGNHRDGSLGAERTTAALLGLDEFTNVVVSAAARSPLPCLVGPVDLLEPVNFPVGRFTGYLRDTK